MESMTSNQKKQILRFAEDVLDKINLSKPQAQQIIEQGDVFQNELGKIFEELSVDHQDVVADWQDFYKKYFNLKVDLSRVLIPKHQADFDRIIFIPQGLTIAKTIEIIKSKMKLWTWKSDDSLTDVDVPTNDRDSANGAYAIRIRDRVEADQELKNKSANDLAKEKINGITLLERLVFELKYHQETGKHLDIDNWTLCFGSRHSDGGVPRVCWDSGSDELGVNWANADDAGGGLRSRAVVSC